MSMEPPARFALASVGYKPTILLLNESGLEMAGAERVARPSFGLEPKRLLLSYAPVERGARFELALCRVEACRLIQSASRAS